MSTCSAAGSSMAVTYTEHCNRNCTDCHNDICMYICSCLALARRAEVSYDTGGLVELPLPRPHSRYTLLLLLLLFFWIRQVCTWNFQGFISLALFLFSLL